MSTDLSRPLVPSMGHHDPLDGLITYWQLELAVKQNKSLSEEEKKKLSLMTEIKDMESMCKGRDWETSDSLGLGGILVDCFRIEQINREEKSQEKEDLLKQLLKDSLSGLKKFNNEDKLDSPAKYRLAFRELGLSLGLQAIEKLNKEILENGTGYSNKDKIEGIVKSILSERGLVDKIHKFWGDSKNQISSTWKDHLDINMVMYATSLTPDGFLKII